MEEKSIAVIDVFAGIGTFSSAAAKTSARVILAIEPHPLLCSIHQVAFPEVPVYDRQDGLARLDGIVTDTIVSVKGGPRVFLNGSAIHPFRWHMALSKPEKERLELEERERFHAMYKTFTNLQENGSICDWVIHCDKSLVNWLAHHVGRPTFRLLRAKRTSLLTLGILQERNLYTISSSGSLPNTDMAAELFGMLRPWPVILGLPSRAVMFRSIFPKDVITRADMERCVREQDFVAGTNIPFTLTEASTHFVRYNAHDTGAEQLRVLTALEMSKLLHFDDDLVGTQDWLGVAEKKTILLRSTPPRMHALVIASLCGRAR